METAKIERINELYRKSKAEGLTEEEKKEQQILRREYVDAFKHFNQGEGWIHYKSGREIWTEKRKLGQKF